MKVFISWSGERSKLLTEALKDKIPHPQDHHERLHYVREMRELLIARRKIGELLHAARKSTGARRFIPGPSTQTED